jgi:hypothetical protein
MSAETKIIDLMRLEGKTRERIVAEAVALLEDYYSLQRYCSHLPHCRRCYGSVGGQMRRLKCWLGWHYGARWVNPRTGQVVRSTCWYCGKEEGK